MEELWIYESHMGELYTSPTEIDDESLYCETCGDSDWPIGKASSRAEAKALLNEEDWNPEYINQFIKENWSN